MGPRCEVSGRECIREAGEKENGRIGSGWFRKQNANILPGIFNRFSMQRMSSRSSRDQSSPSSASTATNSSSSLMRISNPSTAGSCFGRACLRLCVAHAVPVFLRCFVRFLVLLVSTSAPLSARSLSFARNRPGFLSLSFSPPCCLRKRFDRYCPSRFPATSRAVSTRPNGYVRRSPRDLQPACIFRICNPFRASPSSLEGVTQRLLSVFHLFALGRNRRKRQNRIGNQFICERLAAGCA